ncbi:MAG TPA: 30S ribosomal protein S20 [bacterium]|jgi:small subunit ribosomal protein S20|nr:30S ribosomal protein S20 [bacterium]
MPIIKSAKKALRASLRKEKRNANQKKLLKEALRLVNAQNINATFSKIDKAAKNNIIHPNKAARFKAKLAKSVGVTPKATKAVAPKAKAKMATKKVATKKGASKVAGKTPKRVTKTAKAKTVKKEK